MSDVDSSLAKRMDYIAELKTAIRNLHGCEPEYVESVPVTETFQGETLWTGDVEVFTIRGHPKAKRAYAWGHASGDNDRARRYVAVLDLPPVDSPETAVKVAVAAEIKDARKKQT
jgi:hypothetical protein